MSNITVSFGPRSKYRLEYKSFVFPGGEVGVKFDDKISAAEVINVAIKLNAREPKDLIELAMVKDAATRRFRPNSIALVMPYIPYARQDRVCDNGESFSLKVFADYINFLNFASVTVYDPHSDVAPALINNVIVVNQVDIIRRFPALVSKITQGAILVSPDAGASKKTQNIAKEFGLSEYVRADKLRDLSTGEIKETIVYREDFKGQDVVICDDIADGARTFVELAKVCKAKNCGKLYLYVTHGIFSKGFDSILGKYIDGIFTTDSFRSDFPELPNLDVLKLNCFL